MSESVISRAEAKAIGLRHYFTGRPCKRNHVAKRLVSTNQCVDCKLIQCREYYANNAAFRNGILAKNKENAEHIKALARQRYAKDPEKAREKNRRMYAKHAEKRRAKSLRYIKANPHINVANAQKRRALEFRATRACSKDWDDFVTHEAADLAARRGDVFGFRWSVDHRIPLRAKEASGLHVAENLQVIPFVLNSRKRNTMVFTTPLAWLEAAT